MQTSTAMRGTGLASRRAMSGTALPRNSAARRVVLRANARSVVRVRAEKVRDKSSTYDLLTGEIDGAMRACWL